MTRLGGIRARSRGKLTKNHKQRGKLKIRNHLQTFKIGDAVQLLPDSSVQKGQFHFRFYGRQGKITQKQGRSYYVTFDDHGVSKSIIVPPVHIKRL